MYGHEGVSRDLKRRFEASLPVHLEAIRAEKGATALELPDPADVYPHFVPDVDITAYPALSLTELDTPNGLTGAREVQAGTRWDSYVYNYPFRVWVYVFSADYGATELQLKRYLTAMRMCLLENRVLTDNDAAYVTIDPETISENFDSPLEDEARQVLGAGFIGVVLESSEVINVSTHDPRSRLPVLVDGTVTAADRTTGDPAGAPAVVPGGGL